MGCKVFRWVMYMVQSCVLRQWAAAMNLWRVETAVAGHDPGVELNTSGGMPWPG
jgi:hypothetical protein